MDLCEGIYDVTSFALNRAYKDVVKPLADIYNKASDIMDKIPTPVKIAAGLVGGAIAIGTGIAPAIVAGTIIKAALSGAVISGAMYGVSSLFTGNFDKKEFLNSMLHGATDMFMISGVTLGVKGVVDCVTRNSGRIKSFLANESGEISVSRGGSDVVSWSNHGYKHFLNKNTLWKDIVKSTKTGPAKYSFDIQDVEVFERAAWESVTPVTNGKNWRVNKYDTTIGAVNGKETVYVRIENSSNTIHGHPISESEYNKLLKEH